MHLYLSAPVLGWEAMLNMTKVELELIPDADVYLVYSVFDKKGMKGGVSYICKWYSKADNSYLKPYDFKQESKYII